jgi:cell division protein FtsB
MVAKKRKYKKGSKSDKALTGLLMFFDVLIIGFLVLGNLKLLSETRQISTQFLDINQELERLELKNQELEEVFSIASQDEYAEKLLREKGLYKKEGEEVVVITRDNVPEGSAKQASENETASIWDKIADFFKQIFGR